MFRWFIRNSIPVPVIRHPEQLCLGHLDDRQHLTAFRDQRVISRPHDAEGAPKPDPLELVEPAFDHEPVAQFRRAAVIDLGPDDHRILLVLGHLREAEPELFGEKGPRDFDEAQVGDVMNDGGAVRIEEHHLHVGADARRAFVQHAKPSFRKRSLKQRNCQVRDIRRLAVAPRLLGWDGHDACYSRLACRGVRAKLSCPKARGWPRSRGPSHIFSSEETDSATSPAVTAFMQRKSIGHSRRKQGLHST